MNQVTILFLSSNPPELDRLQLDEEIRAITAKIRASDRRERIEIVAGHAVRADDLLQILNELQPHIIHFSGHGNSNGEIILVDDQGQPKPISQLAIYELLRTLGQKCRVVVLNACYSLDQARMLVDVVDCAIGMEAQLDDRAAIIFAASFYRAIGFGHSVQNAYEQGCAALLLEGSSPEHAPTLFVQQGVDADSISLIDEYAGASHYLPPLIEKPFLFDPGVAISVTVAPKSDPTIDFSVPLLRDNYVVFAFGVTNPNQVDMSVDGLFVEVLEYCAVDIVDERGGGLGGVPFRRTVCLLAPKPGRYRCQAISADYDYIRLGQGEMERFSVNVQVEKSGVYALKIGFRYAIGGERHILFAHDSAFRAYFSANDSARRVDHWNDSGWPELWVNAQRGQWNHADWEALLHELEQSIYWPMETDEVGRVLEERKQRWHSYRHY